MPGKAAWIVRIGAMQRLAVVVAVGVVAYFALPRSIWWHARAVASRDLSVLAFVFNMAVLALSINIIASVI